MTWSEAHDHYRLLRAAETELDVTGVLPWRAEHAAVFGSPVRLRLALVTRWRRLVEAQGADVPIAELAAAHPGLARLSGLHTPPIDPRVLNA